MRSRSSGASGLQSLAGAARRLDLLLGGGAEGVRSHRQLRRDLAAGEDLDRVRALRQALLLQRLRRHLGAGLEALLKIGEVDRLRLGPEVLKRHRLLHVRPAQLAHPHVDRVLPTLIAGLALGARPSPGALMAPPRGLPEPTPLAPSQPPARPPRAGLGLQAMKTDLFRAGFLSHRLPRPDE